MDALIAKLEAAKEGSRELDARLWHIAHGKGQKLHVIGPPTYDEPRYFCNPLPSVDWIGYDLLNIAHAYTASIDAAVTLVPAGWAWFVQWIGAPFTEGFARLWIPSQRTHGLQCENVQVEAKTPALALCIAALKARGEVRVQNVSHETSMA